MPQPDSHATAATLRVAFVVGVTPSKWARVWAERMPHTSLELMPCSPRQALTLLQNSAVDAALLRMPIHGEHLSSIDLYTELPVVVASKDHAIEALDHVTLDDLRGERLLSSDVQDGDWAPVVELVATGAGVAVMPQSVARALSRRDVIARPVSDGDESHIALVWLASRENPLVDEFIGIVRGRTANSSRGPQPPHEKKAKPSKPRTPDRRPSRRR